MAGKKPSKRTTKVSNESDSAYLLKLVLYIIVGAQWVRFVNVDATKQIPIPIGLIIGLIFASHEHFKLDRKIEIAILLMATMVGFWSQVGIYITVLK